jgi:glyoxylase-like metal-dependent hydrolase (beta-lactamase superfamily II)/ferredoxin
MARATARLPQNAPGDFFVDDSCIDCGVCRYVAAASFARADEVGLSFVRRQPASEAERTRALMALVACPTASIGSASLAGAREAARRFPDEIAGGVHFCGFTSEQSFGGASYLIRREKGNVLVDSPRAAGPLLERIGELGGVRTMFLTHADDVADHAAFARRFGCERVMHEADIGADTAGVERRLAGREPVRLGPDLLAIPVPGHTAGSTALLYREEFLFTGDHLWWDAEERRLGASRDYCWDDWEEQVRSLERLLAFDFRWVLPGHGDPWDAASAAEMRRELTRLIDSIR